jgi:hypothetical protein
LGFEVMSGMVSESSETGNSEVRQSMGMGGNAGYFAPYNCAAIASMAR